MVFSLIESRPRLVSLKEGLRAEENLVWLIYTETLDLIELSACRRDGNEIGTISHLLYRVPENLTSLYSKYFRHKLNQLFETLVKCTKGAIGSVERLTYCKPI